MIQLTIVKMVGRDSRVNPLLDRWLLRMAARGHLVDLSPEPGPEVGGARNGLVKHFRDFGRTEYLLLVDADQIWDPAADPILSAPGDVLYCDYISQFGALAHGGELGCGCLRVSRHALRRITPPWFQFRRDAHGCRLEECECRWFLARAREAGLEPRSVGRIGHIVPFVAMPDAEGRMCLKTLALAMKEAFETDGRTPL